MDKLIAIYESWVANYGVPGLLLMVAIIALLAVQLYYWLGIYSRIPVYRNKTAKPAKEQALPGISVVVVVRDEMRYVEEILPSLLEQEYPSFEVVVVNMASQGEIGEALGITALRYGNLHVTQLVQQEQRFPITNKMALNVGIKAAMYPHIVMTTTEARPASQKWLAMMGRGFLSGKVVIGYCGIEAAAGLANAFMRAGRLNLSMRYLGAAVRGKTYRGIAENLGYASDLYFKVKGFDHLDLDRGDDDLFVQRVAHKNNVSVVMGRHGSTRQIVWGSTGDWFARQIFARSTWKFYPQEVKNYVEWDTFSRALLFAACLAAILWLPAEIKIAAGTILVLRLAIVEFQVSRICRRLGERGLLLIYIMYDLFSPLYSLTLWFASIFHKRSKWK